MFDVTEMMKQKKFLNKVIVSNAYEAFCLDLLFISLPTHN